MSYAMRRPLAVPALWVIAFFAIAAAFAAARRARQATADDASSEISDLRSETEAQSSRLDDLESKDSEQDEEIAAAQGRNW